MLHEEREKFWIKNKKNKTHTKKQIPPPKKKTTKNKTKNSPKSKNPCRLHLPIRLRLSNKLNQKKKITNLTSLSSWIYKSLKKLKAQKQNTNTREKIFRHAAIHRTNNFSNTKIFSTVGYNFNIRISSTILLTNDTKYKSRKSFDYFFTRFVNENLLKGFYV